MKVDYIIVGFGLAGVTFCEQLRANGKSFVVFDDGSQKSSLVAAGLYNPVILKRFTAVWKSEEQLEILKEFYNRIEKRFNIQLDFQIPVHRKFASLEEQNDWFIASDKPNLSKYLSNKIIGNSNNAIIAPHGFGKVKGTGRIDIKRLISAYKKELIQDKRLKNETFNYKDLKFINGNIIFNNIEAKHIVFMEGYGMKKNPYFKHLPLMGTKGELLVIYAPDLKLEYILKSSVFIVPIDNDKYIVGATYNWEDKSNKATEEAEQELIEKLDKLIRSPYKIESQVAGIRPTVKDRRPLVGTHPKYSNVHVLNGLGTRGVMIGPYVANALFEAIEYEKPLDKEIDINRFN